MDALSAIKVAYKQLVIDHPYIGITISQISEKADVSRKTFYRYFDSKDDIAVAIIQDDFVHPVTTIGTIFHLDEIKSATRLMMERLYRVFSDNRDYYSHLIAGIGRLAFIDLFVHEVACMSEQMYVKNGVPPLEAQYTSEINTASQALSLIWWLDHQELDYRQIADMDIRCIHPLLGAYSSANLPKES